MKIVKCKRIVVKEGKTYEWVFRDSPYTLELYHDLHSGLHECELYTGEAGLLCMLMRESKKCWLGAAVYRWKKFTVRLAPSCMRRAGYYARRCGLLGYRPSGCRDVVKHHRYQLTFHTAVFKNTGRFGLLQGVRAFREALG
jgi:hypothetical protein